MSTPHFSKPEQKQVQRINEYLRKFINRELASKPLAVDIIELAATAKCKKLNKKVLQAALNDPHFDLVEFEIVQDRDDGDYLLITPCR